MPNITATITPEQRDGLYELLRDHLRGLGDVWITLDESHDYANAKRLGREFSDDFRLLEDVGWDPSEDRPEFILTMPAFDLRELLRRMQGEAQQILVGAASERPMSEEDIEINRRFQVAYQTCEELLASLGQREGDPV